jgi:hypothetical protein
LVFPNFAVSISEDSMLEQNFDTLAHRAATAVSRRASLLGLGTWGLTALAAPISTAAKSKKAKKKKKTGKKDNQQCQQELADCTAQATQCAGQVEPCTSFLTAICAGDPGCLAQQGPCCAFLERCDASEFITCLLY